MAEIDLEALADRVEKLEGPSAEIDRTIAEAAYEGRWPMAFYGGPINYDPALWIERYSFCPTSSLDDALAIVPDGLIWGIANCGIKNDQPDLSRATATCGKLDDTVAPIEAATPAIALTAAALRARLMEGEGEK